MRRLNGWLTIFWVSMIPLSYELGCLKSVTYVSALSLWALVSGRGECSGVSPERRAASPPAQIPRRCCGDPGSALPRGSLLAPLPRTAAYLRRWRLLGAGV